MDKFLKGLMIVGFLCATGMSIQFARADECANGKFTEQAEAFKERGNEVTQLNKDQIANLVAKAGQPPNTVGEFDAYLVVQSPLAAVFAVQNGCTMDRLGPASEDSINHILGIVNAKAAPAGERVD